MLSVELTHAVGDLSLEVRFQVAPGRCLALAGPSGAGKTTILRLLAGLTRPDRGLVTLAGTAWVDTSAGICLAPERRRCGYVFQDYALFPHLNAWRNVAYGLRGTPAPARRSRALELLERFGLAERAGARPATLSGGERQRVALARALAPQPAALLLDEPLSSLDPRTRSAAGRELASILRTLEIPVVLVSHSFEEAARIGDQIAILDGGEIVQCGTATELAAEPASAFVADFAGAVVLAGEVRQAAGPLTVVALDGGGLASSTDAASGRVAVCVFPWEITIGLDEAAVEEESAQNRLLATITSVTAVGNRVRLGLDAGQPLVAEVTGKATEELRLAVGQQVVASWKATATRLVAL